MDRVKFGPMLSALLGHNIDRLQRRLGLNAAKMVSIIEYGYPPDLRWLGAIDDVANIDPAMKGELVLAALRANGLDKLAGWVESLIKFHADNGLKKTPFQIRQDNDAKAHADYLAWLDRQAEAVESPTRTLPFPRKRKGK